MECEKFKNKVFGEIGRYAPDLKIKKVPMNTLHWTDATGIGIDGGSIFLEIAKKVSATQTVYAEIDDNTIILSIITNAGSVIEMEIEIDDEYNFAPEPEVVETAETQSEKQIENPTWDKPVKI